MDHMTSLRNTFSHDMVAECQSASVDSFSNQSSSYPMVQYGHRSSVNCQGQLEYTPPAYGLSTGQQYAHTIPQSFQSNASDRQMTNSFICQSPAQHHPDNFYPYQTQTPPFFPQKHQSGSNQLLQSPEPPCHSQASSVNMYQSQSPQFSPLPAHPQISQMSPRHHHQNLQAPLVSSQKNQQIQSLPNQQHQPTIMMNGSIQPQRPDQSSKLVVSKQQNSPKDRISDGQFYSAQCSQRADTSHNKLHKTHPYSGSFGHIVQPHSPAHVPHVFQPGGTNSGTKVNGDSWSRSHQGSQFGASVQTHSNNQIKPSTYLHSSCFEHPVTTLPSNIQQVMYGNNEGISTSSQRIQKSAPNASGLPYRPQVPSNPNCYVDHNMLPAFSIVASNHPHCTVSTKSSSIKPISDTAAGDYSSVQNMHYKPRNPHIVSSQNRDGKNVINTGNMSARYVRTANGDTIFLENQLVDGTHPHRINNTKPCSVFSVAALSESSQGVTRGRKMSDATTTGNNRISGPGKIVKQKSTENSSPVNWYKCPNPSLVSSFQSDIEAMQADVASYVSNSEMLRMTNRTAQGKPVQKSTDSPANSLSGYNQTSQTLETQRNVSDKSSKPSHASSKMTRAEALAAIQIKQEVVDNLNKYRTVSSSSAASNLTTDTAQVIKAAHQKGIVSTNSAHSVRDTSRFSAPAKDIERNAHPMSQSDISARRYSAVEFDQRSLEVVCGQGTSANRPLHMQTKSNTPAKASTIDYPLSQNVDSMSGQQVLIQNRRHTVPCLPDRTSPWSRCETLGSPEQRQNIDIQRSPAPRQSIGVLDFPSQSIIHHLFDQVQSIESQYSNGRQQSGTTINKTIHKDCPGSLDGARKLAVSCGKKGLPASENIFDTWTTGQAASSPAGSVEQGNVRAAASMINKNSRTSPGQGIDSTQFSITNSTLYNTDHSVSSATLSDTTHREVPAVAFKPITKDNSRETKKSTSTVCCVMLHGHKLICLKSSFDALLLLYQFQVDCFADRSMESIDYCIDQTLKISRKFLNHQDEERIELFLKKSGYDLGNMVQTINLDDARRVYHHIYGITCCTNPSCVVEMFQQKVDLDRSGSLSNDKSNTKQVKMEKKSADDNAYGKLMFNVNREISSNTYAGNHQTLMHSHNQTKDVKEQPNSKSLNSQVFTSVQTLPRLGPGSAGNDHSITNGTDFDCGDSDDLILVETSDDSNVIRWSGNAPKTGGLCNTIVGQLRSYVHEDQRYLVVDDLCKVFGSTDFYDGVEKENIILYSCCQEVANFLNAISANFQPLQSLRDSLVKEKDIGIQITDTNYIPVTSSLEKSVLGSSFLKRPLCKQEILDDCCSSPKQFRFEDSMQVPASKNQQLNLQQTLVAKQKKCAEKPVTGSDISNCLLTDGGKSQNSDSLVTRIEVTKNSLPVVCSDISSVTKESNLPLAASRSLDPPDSSDKNTLDAETEEVNKLVQDVSSNSAQKCSLPSIVSGSSRQTFENNNDKNSNCSKNFSFTTTDSFNDKCIPNTKQFAEVGEHETSICVPPPASVNDTACSIVDSSNLVHHKETDFSIVQPNYSAISESSNLAASVDELPCSFFIDLNNSATALKKTVDENKLASKNSEFSSHNNEQQQELSDSLTEITSESQSCTPFIQHISVQKLLDAEDKSNKHENLDNLNDYSKPTLSQQADSLKTNLLTNGDVGDCFNNIMSGQQAVEQDTGLSNPASSILRTRMEKLQHQLEARRNKDLPIPRFLLDSSLKLNLLTDEVCCAKDKNDVTDISRTEIILLNNVDPKTMGLNSQIKETISNSDINCVQNVMTPEIRSQKEDTSDLCIQDRSEVVLPDQQQLSPKIATSALPQEESRTLLSVLDLDKDQAPLSMLPLSRYYPGNHKSVDDTDVMFSSSLDLLGVRPSCYWGAYTKLWHENRALLGMVDLLKKSLADAKAEKERSEKISHYYEAVIQDISSTVKNGEEQVPGAVLNGDSKIHQKKHLQ